MRCMRTAPYHAVTVTVLSFSPSRCILLEIIFVLRMILSRLTLFTLGYPSLPRFMVRVLWCLKSQNASYEPLTSGV